MISRYRGLRAAPYSCLSDQTVGNILKRHGLPTTPKRKKTTWREFIRRHLDILWATDFFSTEVWTMGGLVTLCVLFFIKLDTREIHIAGVTPHPNERWMKQVEYLCGKMGEVGERGSVIQFILFGENSLRHVLAEGKQG